MASKPTAPPVPFQYVGKKLVEGQWTVFLARDDSTLPVKVGDVLEDAYRVRSIDSSRLVFEYLPLKQEQTLDLE